MRIFISWSGERSKQIAEAFRHWLPDVIQSVKPYFTPDDVSKGQRWASDIAEHLHSCEFGVFCLTSDNLNAPWLLFEAGAVSKDRHRKVCPLLFGVDSTQLEGPLVQFQATPYSRDEVFKFMRSVNAATSEPLDDSQLKKSFDRCWDELDEKVQAILNNSDASETAPARRSLDDMVEETLNLVRAINQTSHAPIEEESANHWLVLLQTTLEYANDTLAIAENTEQYAMLEQLKRLIPYVKVVSNLVMPKIKGSKVSATYSREASKTIIQLNLRTEQLERALDLDIPF